HFNGNSAGRTGGDGPNGSGPAGPSGGPGVRSFFNQCARQGGRESAGERCAPKLPQRRVVMPPARRAPRVGDVQGDWPQVPTPFIALSLISARVDTRPSNGRES